MLFPVGDAERVYDDDHDIIHEGLVSLAEPKLIDTDESMPMSHDEVC